jgi:hypothetical protein
MPDLAASIISLKAALRQGTLLKISGTYPFDTPRPHRFIVLNASPDEETLIVAPHATHNVQIESEKAYGQNEDVVKTVVVFRPNTYGFFPRQTAVNCNELHLMSFQKLAEAMARGDLVIQTNETLNSTDLQKVIEGALASTQTSPLIASYINGVDTKS